MMMMKCDDVMGVRALAPRLPPQRPAPAPPTTPRTASLPIKQHACMLAWRCVHITPQIMIPSHDVNARLNARANTPQITPTTQTHPTHALQPPPARGARASHGRPCCRSAWLACGEGSPASGATRGILFTFFCSGGLLG